MEFERKLDAKLVLAIVATGLMSFCGVLVETAMNVTFPTLMEEFSVTTSTVQWITTGYLLVLATIVPTSSFLNKKFKMKQLFLLAVILFIAGTLLSALAPSFIFLLLGRLIQGVGTGLALPLMYNIILQQTPYDKLGMMMGVGMMITGVAPAIGPTVGGLMVETYGWRTIFIVLLPFLIFALIVGVISIRQSTKISKPSFDLRGYLLLAGCFASLIIGCSMAGAFGWISAPTLLLLAASFLCALGFVKCTLHRKNALINLRVFRSRQFTCSLCAFSITFFMVLSISYLIPNFSQLAIGQSALIAGLIMLPGSILTMLLSPIGGKLYDRVGAKFPLTLGIVVVIISQIIFLLMIQNARPVTLMVTYLIFAFGQCLIIGNTMTHGIKGLAEALNADGNAVYNTAQQLFGAIGTSIISSIVAASQASYDMTLGTITGTMHAFILLIVLSASGFFSIITALKKKNA
ncbi:DHA2 family efflux MFS transporter permease subunit [Eubacterium oxidoreducens]|uniref:Drug resistance transporter, EmrB/QacA subfamily n=1 Tax=Eubacterium oxidoreducens TaxID=1732 RepID=A0A1G6ADW3_EUBOX|nr:DHA2 family efflux MFS transporter permease subunit [Eubacterium oxidoreducens]SDB06500.1 drug resistance transporter, EmrB/QacA subfamily [Eubacterium oxidoreducens]